MKYFLGFLSVLFLVACTDDEIASPDLQEAAQQLGDVMASVDESGGSTGTLALMETQRRGYKNLNDRLLGSPLDPLWQALNPMPQATAVTCDNASTFGACTGNTITRDFNGCTIGNATFNGGVILTFNDNGSACAINDVGERIDREPGFVVTGLRDAALTVTKTGTIGQRIQRTGATTFTLSNDGIRRVFSLSGVDLFSYTTTTTSSITVTGNNRNGRVMNGGTLQVTNNLTSVTCDYTPSNITWTANCNCPTSGSWTGTCSDGKSTDLTINSCGAAILTVGESTQSLSFDRCYGS